MPPQGIWDLFEREWCGDLRDGDAEYFIPLKKITDGDEHGTSMYGEDDNDGDMSGSTVQPTPQSTTTISKPKPDPLPSPTVPLLPLRQLIRKLRWITLGYQYHWATKTYHLDRRVAFPDDVGELSVAIVRAVQGVGLDEEGWRNDYYGDNFRPEAGVVNYYQLRDTLMGHVDRSEVNMEAPLVSVR